jgi:FkbM family methyltransferase
MKSFYSNLVPQNSLVFDIGANVGGFSFVFASIGARVVAVEPNADCVRHIQLSSGTEAIQVVTAAVGPQNGLATLYQADELDAVSSLSSEWMAAIRRHHPQYDHLWSKKVTVPMVSLDTLVKHYGMPEFIKIDVEGFEESVLDGLSSQPDLLSFEFNAAFIHSALRCIDKPLLSAGSLFNFALGDPTHFELPEWVGREGVKAILLAMEERDQHGDIFVKRGIRAGQRVPDRENKG